MYRRFQDRFGTAGVIVAVVALIAALSGTALAASGALTGKQKKEVEKIAKKYAGKPGANGKDGTNGTNGTNGKDGAPGAAGKDGTNGTPGAPGAPGNSPQVIEEFTAGEPGSGCDENGGVLYKVEGSGEPPVEVCDGEDGSPWTAGGTLPPGATETGAWTVGPGRGIISTAFSFPIPLAEKIRGPNVKIEGVSSDFFTACTGSGNKPKAPPGVICIYPTGASQIPYKEPMLGELEGQFNRELNEKGEEVFAPQSVVENEEGEVIEVIPQEMTTAFAGALFWWNLGSEPEPGKVLNGTVVGSYAVTGCSEEVGAEFPCP